MAEKSISQYLLPSEITETDIRQICALKNQSWPHSMESQLAWWKRNTAADDILVTVVRKGSILAFLRLRSREILVNGARLGALCVSEVCVEKSNRGRGIGAQLINLASDRVKQTASSIGYLLCRDTQRPFYEACGWHRTIANLQIESSEGVRRSLAESEWCMVLDPREQLNGQIVLVGDVF